MSSWSRGSVNDNLHPHVEHAVQQGEQPEQQQPLGIEPLPGSLTGRKLQEPTTLGREEHQLAGLLPGPHLGDEHQPEPGAHLAPAGHYQRGLDGGDFPREAEIGRVQELQQPEAQGGVLLDGLGQRAKVRRLLLDHVEDTEAGGKIA